MTESIRKRQPRGVPVGGQFAANEHDEAASLSPAPEAREIITRARDLAVGDTIIDAIHDDPNAEWKVESVERRGGQVFTTITHDGSSRSAIFSDSTHVKTSSQATSALASELRRGDVAYYDRFDEGIGADVSTKYTVTRAETMTDIMTRAQTHVIDFVDADGNVSQTVYGAKSSLPYVVVNPRPEGRDAKELRREQRDVGIRRRLINKEQIDGEVAERYLAIAEDPGADMFIAAGVSMDADLYRHEGHTEIADRLDAASAAIRERFTG